MSRWTSRLDRLESEIGGRGCPECGAGGQGPVEITFGPWRDPRPEPCSSCGSVPFTFTLKLDNPNDLPTEWGEGA